jgi:alpha-beta hydrolase superfamily lysophospholipase
MNPTTILRRIAYFLLAYSALAFAAGVFVAEGTLHPGRRPLADSDQIVGRELVQQYDSDFALVGISATDGVPLQAWYLRPRTRSGQTVILFHGLSDNRLGVISYAQIFLKHGYDVLMPDARAHGASGGDLATYGLRESGDIRAWLDWLKVNEHPSCMYGFAESMGAAGLLQSLQSEKRFCAIVAESPFSTFREIAYDRMGQFFHVGPWLGRTILRPVVELAFIDARWKYGLDFEQVSPERAVASTRVPVLLIHGKADRNIPVRHSRKIAAGNHTVFLWEVPGADHCGAQGAEPEEFERKVIAWFEQNNRSNATNGAAAGL